MVKKMAVKETGIKHFPKDFGTLMTKRDAIRVDDTIKQLMSDGDELLATLLFILTVCSRADRDKSESH